MRVEPFDTQRHMVFSRRAALFSGGSMLLFGGIGYRLWQLQVRDHEDYQVRADNNRFNQRVIVPLRGEIYDRFGVPLATNRQNFRVLLVAEEVKDIAGTLAEVSKIVDLTPQEQERVLREVQRKRAFTPIEVADNLSWEDFAKVNFQGPKLRGIHTEVGYTRDYPFKDQTAFVVGYVGAPSDVDIDAVGDDEKTERLLRQPGFRIGKAGLERSHDEELRGKAGSTIVQVNAHGRVIEEYPNESDKSIQGGTLGLTIDAELQMAAMEVLARPVIEPKEGEEPEKISASAVVMDVETGDVIVMASTPAYDPNEFNVGIRQSLWESLNKDPLKPLINKPLAGNYPPGSTFKLITAIAAQEAGIKPSHRVHCGGRIWYGNRYFNCWKRGGHGTLDMKGSIKHSCDVYYWDLAQRVDIDKIAEVAHRFGLGETYDLGIGNQSAGVVPSREWKKNYFASTPERQTWFPGETLSVAIGQGYVTATPLQLAVMTARIATGKQVQPRLIRAHADGVVPPPASPDINIKLDDLIAVRDGMNAVTNEWGTAARSRLEDPDWQMAGKTGTSQVASLQYDARGNRIKNEDLPRHLRDHALFVAFAPYENPKYAISVVVEHGSSGSGAAGPKARDIMKAVTAKNPSALPGFNPATDEPVKMASLAYELPASTNPGGGSR
ncbi:penicillin-binding protein 2 [Parvularcula flava]|uniref:Penicillin-binding protein 2 n=1 Tax=Aquisalinus luteolus TaxID=1566827 RepID=A0A8J3A1S2_9PROT|nr:penicillin-binding protein 2 [Aquisalinus luteolus]NHK27833.1 penicillin-binding protein 2 [Aquisalinus luteolus]GGH96645.1 peptidoglycan glycosyltransferase [Aquisalinus luteolus]